jgi:hypothetical protein
MSIDAQTDRVSVRRFRTRCDNAIEERNDIDYRWTPLVLPG